MIAALGRRLATLSPRAILAIGWVGLMLYAYPGFMSYDSMRQLLEARAGAYAGAHPPMMGALWASVDAVIAGPIGMLIIQTTCFLGGAYLLLRTVMSPRVAAVCATLTLWFPPIAAVLAVIWKDSQMTGYLVLGAALLLSPRRGVRIAALALLAMATAMRYNALAITLPLVLLLFAWSPAQRWWTRYPLALAAWLAITLLAGFVNRQLADEARPVSLWHDSLALMDLVGTLRYAPDLSDDRLRAELAGAPLIATTGIQRAARSSHRAEDLPEGMVRTFGGGRYVPSLWVTTHHVFAAPTTAAHRAAIERAWKAIVPSYPTAYLEYRWHVLRERIHLGDREIPLATYVRFTDALDADGSAGHAARASRIQRQLRDGMRWLGTSWLFRPYVYLALSLAFVGLCLRRRELAALALSGLANEAALFFLAPTIDYRYSIWLVAATVIVVMMLIATRARRDRSC